MAESAFHTHPDDPADRLSALLDDALTGSARETAQHQVDACAACRAELADLRQMRGLLRDLPVVVPPRSFTLDPALYQRARGSGWLGLLRWGGALALLLVFLGIGVAALRSGGGQTTSASLPAPPANPVAGGGPANAAGAAATMAAASGAADAAESSAPTSMAALAPGAAMAGAAPAATATAGGAAADSAPLPPAPAAAAGQTGAATAAGLRQSLAIAVTPTGEVLPTPPPVTMATAAALPTASPPAAAPPRTARIGTLWLVLMAVLVIAIVVGVLRRRR